MNNQVSSLRRTFAVDRFLLGRSHCCLYVSSYRVVKHSSILKTTILACRLLKACTVTCLTDQDSKRERINGTMVGIQVATGSVRTYIFRRAATSRGPAVFLPNQRKSTLLLPHRLLNNSILPLRPLPKNTTPNPHLITPRFHRPLKIRTHPHTQLQPLRLPPKPLSHRIPRLPQPNKIFILPPLHHSPTPRNRPNSHQPPDLQTLTLVHNMFAQRQCVARFHTTLRCLPTGVDLHQDAQFLRLRITR